MKLCYLLIAFVLSMAGLKDALAGLYLGYNANYMYTSSVTDESDAASGKMKYSGLGHEIELGWSIGLSGLRVIPLVGLVQFKLKPGSNDSNSNLTIYPDSKYKMGRLSYGARIDLGSALYLKAGGAIYSLTQDPAPSNNFHINGNGYFAEGGLVFNLVPYTSFVLGARYEIATYEKYRTKTTGSSLDYPVKQNNIIAIFGISLRI